MATDQGWFKTLMDDLGSKIDHYEVLDNYQRGTPTIPYATTKAIRGAFQRLMDISRTNYAALVTDAARERMQPMGFRTGASPDALGDREAWRIWQANSLDADVHLLFTPQLSMGAAYAIVGNVDPDIGAPLITAEDPRQVNVAYDPRRRRKVVAALKVYVDVNAGKDVAYLYLPGVVQRFARDSMGDNIRYDNSGWKPDANAEVLPPNIGVPVVPFLNRADKFYRTQGEFEPHIPLLDRINYTVLERVEIATLQAFRQRAVKGDLPTHDQDGNEIDYDDIFSADPGALWQLPSTIEIWESGVVDLTPIRTAVRDDVQDLAAVSRTPLYYLSPENNQSAEGASLAREGLVFRTRDAIRQSSEALEAVMSLAFRFSGDDARAARPDLEVIWEPVDKPSLAERAQAASMAQATGVPWRTIMLDIWGFDATQVDRMEAERAAEALMNRLAAPAQPAALPPVQGNAAPAQMATVAAEMMGTPPSGA